MNIAIKSSLILFTFLLLVQPVSGITLTISPENPVAGDEITMTGTASPNEVLRPSIFFEQTANVVDGKYDYRLDGIKIPSGDNNFAVTAENVKNLNVRVKLLLWWTRSADASNGIATVSQGNVPSGTYTIRIDGDSADGASSVPLKITASSKITADGQGNFVYKYSSSGVPPGTFTLNIGGITRTITLSETRATSTTPHRSSSSSSGSAGVSGEKFENIELKEKHELEIFREKMASYMFTNKGNPVLFVNITGNVSAGDVTATVETLRNTSSLVKSPPPGLVYKNVNIWVGTSGFAVPKNIKKASIRFRVENSWLDNNNLSDSDVIMFRWDGGKWIELETTKDTQDASHSYYVAATDMFSSFSISGLKSADMPEATVVTTSVATSPPVVTSRSPTPTPAPVEAPGLGIISGIFSFIILRRKSKK